jgi:hypothetical protein
MVDARIWTLMNLELVAGRVPMLHLREVRTKIRDERIRVLKLAVEMVAAAELLYYRILVCRSLLLPC